MTKRLSTTMVLIKDRTSTMISFLVTPQIKAEKYLISSTLKHDKIPTISLRELDKEYDFNLNGGYETIYGSEILDGGHRTKTWYHFYIGELHTPEGFELEIDGKVYEEEVGGCSWVDFPTEVKDYLSKNIFLSLDVFNTKCPMMKPDRNLEL